MGYNRENYRRIRRAFEEKHLAAKREAEEHREELHRRFPEVAEIDRMLAQTGLKLLREASRGKVNLEDRIAAVQRENQELQAVRADILNSTDTRPTTQPYIMNVLSARIPVLMVKRSADA